MLPLASAIAIESSAVALEAFNATEAAVPLPSDIPQYERLVQIAAKLPPTQVTSDNEPLVRRDFKEPSRRYV